MDIEKEYRDYKPGKKRMKKIISKIVFFILGKGIKAASILDQDAKKEIDSMKNGFTFLFEVEPNGPYMALQKQTEKLKYLGQKQRDADLTISFKNIDAAFMMLTAQMSFSEAYCQARIGVKGDPAQSMVLYRISNIVQFYLWPKIIAKMVLKKVPAMTLKKFFIRILLYIKIFLP